jgi:hypothetical protein
MKELTVADPAGAAPAEPPEGSFVSEVDKALDFFATQVKLNLNVNDGGYDPIFHQKAKRRALRAILTALAAL